MLFAVGCGVDRSSEDVEAAPVSVDESGEDLTATTLAPVTPTTGAPDDVAISADFGDDSWEFTHGELNGIVVPTQEDEDFVNLVFRGVPPPDFAITVLAENLFAQAVRTELAAAGGEITDEDLTTSEESLLIQVESFFSTSTDPSGDAQAFYDRSPYLNFLVEYQAAQDALTTALAASADPADGLPCVSHILVETEPEGDAILTRLADGEDFASLAQELSTGPSGPAGGELGCAPSSQYVPEFAAAVDSAVVGEYVGPIQTDFGWHVLVVDRFEVDGRSIASELLQERISAADITVDPALGTWDPLSLTILPVGQ